MLRIWGVPVVVVAITVMATLVSLNLQAQVGERIMFARSNFGEVFAERGNDPYPGEDLIRYCENAAGMAMRILSVRLSGQPKDFFMQQIIKAERMEIPEKTATIDLVNLMYEAPNFKHGIRTYLLVGQRCLDMRRAGTWYTYDWRTDPKYPKLIDRRTQRLVE